MKRFLKLIFVSLSMACLISTGYAQDAGNFSNTALQLSNTFPGGSARIRGLGGAQTALGGDISNLSSNPAGLGFFNRSEFSFTPNFSYTNSSSRYLGQTTDESHLNFNIANLGVVFNRTKGDIVESKWRGGNFGISLNRIADFNSDITYVANNSVSDFIDFAVESDNFGNRNDFSDLAFETFLTDEFYVIYDGSPVSINGVEYNANELYDNPQIGDSLYFIDRNIYRPNGDLAFPTVDEPTRQEETIESRGSTYQASFSYGGNYNDRLYFGASLGVLSHNQEVSRRYIERPANADLSRLIIDDNYEQTGIGINATFGIIARPTAPLLLGLSYTTPSYYAIEQIRTLSLTAEFPDFDNEFEEFVYEPFTYSITTPSKLKAGITYFLGKNGFITGDIESINYGGAKLNNPSDGVDFSEDNNSINRYESVLNYRAGAEYRIGKIRLRGGFAYLGDPTDDELDQSETQLTFGGGFRSKKYFGDIGVIQSISGGESLISPYPTSESATVTQENTRVTLSFGWFF